MITSANLYEAGVLAGIVYVKSMPCGSVVLPTGFYDNGNSEQVYDVATKTICSVGTMKRKFLKRDAQPVSVAHWPPPRHDPLPAILKTLPPPLPGCTWGVPMIPH